MYGLKPVPFTKSLLFNEAELFQSDSFFAFSKRRLVQYKSFGLNRWGGVRHPFSMANREDAAFQELGDRLLVIYDGHCGFCNRSIRWFLVRDRLDRLRFAPSESPDVAALLARHGFGGVSPDTLLVARNVGGPGEVLLTRSAGVIAMLGVLPNPWPAVAWVLKAIPGPVRDLGYRGIARWRYKIWGRFASCPIPTAAERAHFL